jgi:transposase
VWQREPVEPSALNPLLYVAEHGCKWRGLPKQFGNWHTVYTRMNSWSKATAASPAPKARCPLPRLAFIVEAIR